MGEGSLQGFVVNSNGCSCAVVNTTSGFDSFHEDPPMLSRVFQALILGLIIFLSIFGNLLVLLVIYRKKNLRDMTAWFVVNLALADIGGAIINMPVSLISAITRDFIFGETLCTVTALTNSLFCGCSIVTLAMVSIDRYLGQQRHACLKKALEYPGRYIAITDPFHYTKRMTKCKVVCMTVGSWIYCFVIAALPLIGWGRYDYFRDNLACTFNWQSDMTSSVFVAIMIFQVPLCVLIYTYFHIFREATKQARSIRHLHTGLPCLQDKKGTDNKAAKTLFVVLGVFLLCWLPFFIQNVVFPHSFGKQILPGYFTTFCVWTAYGNSACNPIIYGLLNRKYREAFKEIFGHSTLHQKASSILTLRKRSSNSTISDRKRSSSPSNCTLIRQCTVP